MSPAPADTSEQPTLRVMRLYKPRLDGRRVLPVCSTHCEAASSTAVRGEGDFALSSALKLPDSFGNIYLGETFTAYIRFEASCVFRGTVGRISVNECFPNFAPRMFGENECTEPTQLYVKQQYTSDYTGTGGPFCRALDCRRGFAETHGLENQRPCFVVWHFSARNLCQRWSETLGWLAKAVASPVSFRRSTGLSTAAVMRIGAK